ncbi:MAG TPA: hydroxymethylglutaryl-CoA lyase [Desulfobacterales bacterium]|nr:hydroxymethylglutaryl-CoA lyase [Desulfobacterales bacterium]
MNLPKQVMLREVGPRDGLQAEKAFLPTEEKIELINALSKTGLCYIEATSFVHPKAIPQLADAEELLSRIHRNPEVTYGVMVPNPKGAQRAVSSKVDDMMVFFSASETHNLKNVRMTVEQSLQNIQDVLDIAVKADIPVSAIIATSFGCPFEGEISENRLIDLVGRLNDMGIMDIYFGDTTGMANPKQVHNLSTKLLSSFPESRFGLHFHNTRGAGSANILAGLQAGVTRFDGSIAGLGGCPFAPGATGNVSTEDIVHMMEAMGIKTGIDLKALISCARKVQEYIGRELPGQVMKAGICPCSGGLKRYAA